MIDEYMDTAWVQIETVLGQMVMVIDRLMSAFNFLGAPVLIFCLAVVAILTTRLMSKYFVTRRYLKLKKNFEHWQSVRNKALTHPDPVKGKSLARNIDQAELNRAYYDYFFEGMLKNMVTNVLPVLLTAAYIIKIYTPDTLSARFGQSFVFTISFGGDQIVVSSLLWYVLSLAAGFVLYGSVKALTRKKNKANLATQTT